MAADVVVPVGQDDALTTLRDLEASGAHALLFAGPHGVGRRLSARWYAALLNCELRTDDPCGRCASCRAYVPDETGSIAATDYREIVASATTRDGKPARRRRIVIDQLVAREGGDPEPLGPWLWTPPRHRRRVGVVDGAETMTEQASNAFLKTLEEPPERAIVILVATGPDAVPPTVASRCVVIRFRPVAPTPEAWARFHPHPALRLGRPGPLNALERDADFPARDAVAALVASLEGPLDTAFEATGRLADVWEPNDDLVPGLLREHARERGYGVYVRADAAIEAATAALAGYAHRALTLKRLTLALRDVWSVG